jgi:hypothetical protein
MIANSGEIPPKENLVSQKILFLMVLVWLTSLLMVAGSAADTFDGNRKGFIFGAAAGLGVTRYASSNEFASGHGYPAAIAYNFQVGYAPTDRLQLYYTMRQSVIIPEIIDNYKDLFNKIGRKSSGDELYLLISPFVIALIPLLSAQHLMPMGFGIRQYFNSQGPLFFCGSRGWSNGFFLSL